MRSAWVPSFTVASSSSSCEKNESVSSSKAGPLFAWKALGQAVVELGEVGRADRPGVPLVGGLRDVAVVVVTRVAADQRAEASVVVGDVDRVLARAPLVERRAKLRRGGEQLRVGALNWPS